MNQAKIDQAQRDYNAFRADGWEHDTAMMLANVSAQLTADEYAELARRC